MALTMAENLETVIDNAQETEYSYEPEEDDIDLSLLRLNSFGSSSDRRRANSSPPQFQSYGSFGSSSSTAATNSPVKRPSPESKEADEPRRKKLFLPRPEDDEKMSNLMGYSKVPLPMVCNPTQIRSSPLYRRSLSATFASPAGSAFGSGYNTGGGAAQETAPSGNNYVPSLPPRPPLFRRSVSDLSPAPLKALHGSSSRSAANPDADFEIPENSEANKMLYVIKDGVRELDQWCNKLLKYGEAVSSVKQDDSPKAEMELQEEEEQQRECKEGVKVDRIGEAFVVEINCPCGRNYRTLFSGRDCYYKLL
ncbi:unnamed protein product [Microthlaspi erraticum]|uniref:Uncharacterized protein n=1 Tax=Microthlaspi erraticum TaxID=1685480 RepID=A0A6D2KCK7_9BRAS|nr:unnamed protein product [Microthlaspi erraticum]